MLFVVLFFIYQTFQLLALPFFMSYTLVTHIYAGNPDQIIQQKIGLLPKSDPTKNIIWIHALSAGEINAIELLVKKLKNDLPNTQCYVTAGSNEGKKTAEKKLNADYVALLPHDDILSLSLAFSRINPKGIIIVEHEVYPGLQMLAKMKGIPTYLLNAQFTSVSQDNLTRYNFLYKDLFNTFDMVFAQSDQDKSFFVEAGVNQDRVVSIGNIKAYNVLPKKQILEKKIGKTVAEYKKNTDHIVMLLGSVHQGEFDVYLKAFAHFKEKYPNLKLLIAPRKFNWKDELLEKVETIGYSHFMWDKQIPPVDDSKEFIARVTNELLKNHDVLTFHVMGKLFSLYSLADIFCLGGTFIPLGGHNLLEPAAWANPSLIGPYYQDTKEIADELKRHNAVIHVADEKALRDQLGKLLADESARKAMGKRAAGWLENEANRVGSNVDLLLERLG